MAAILAGTATLGGAQTASAAVPWLQPQDLAAPVTVGFFSAPSTPAVAVGRDGSAVVVLRRSDGTNTLAYTADRQPGGAFGAAVARSAGGGDVTSASVAIDRQGTATAVWLRGTQVQTITRPNGGAWGPVRNVPGATDGQEPRIAVGDNGAAAVAWTGTETGTEERVRVAVRQPNAADFAAGTFVSPDVVAPPDDQIYESPRVAMSAAGDVAVVWRRDYDPDGSVRRLVVESSVKPAGAGFDPSQTRSSTVAPNTAGTGDYDVVMSPNGRAIAMWDSTNDASNFVVQYSERSVGATFSSGSWTFSPTAASPPGQSSTSPKLALDDTGTAVATWASNTTVQSSVRLTPGQAFSPAKPLSGPSASTASSTVATAPNGEAVIAWRGVTGADSTLFSARRRAGADSFGEVTEVVRGTASTPSVSFQPAGFFSPVPRLRLGLDDQGNGFMTYVKRTSDGSTDFDTGQAIGFDPVAPVLVDVVVPGSTVAGTSVSFSAGASDRTSGTTIGWDFGDGQTAAGPAPTHAFAAAGVYTVKAVATDAATNRAETTRQIQVTPAPTPPPPPPPTPPGDLDTDRDGVPARLDCNDKDAKIKPGAVEIRGNKVDENCDGKADPFTKVDAASALSWDRLRSGRTRIKSLKVERLLKGDVVSLKCTSRKLGCRKAATVKATTIKKSGTLSFLKAVKGMTLGPKAKLVVTVTRKNAISRIVTYTMVKKKDPTKRQGCQDPGVKTIKAC